MKHSRMVVLATTTLLLGAVCQPVAAQYPGANGPDPGSYGQGDTGNDRNDRGRDNGGTRNENTFKSGYRSGYDDGRANRRFDDSFMSNRRDDRSDAWQRRYSRVYTYNDDNYYQQCRTSADPAGILAGALIGGLVGNAAASGNGRGGATAAGVIVGGTLGASLTQNMSCDDRSYSYRTYYEGFNAGRANQQYEWRNPRNGRRGTMRVDNYYNDPDGFRCAAFTQSIYINGRPQQGNGRACQQPDGTWAIVG